MTITLHEVPGAGPYALTAGPDGGLWFTLVGSGEIGRHDPATGTTVLHPVGPESGPTIITTGPDGALWFTEYRAHRLGRITVSGEVSHIDLPADVGPGPFGIATGADGALWFTACLLYTSPSPRD